MYEENEQLELEQGIQTTLNEDGIDELCTADTLVENETLEEVE